MRQATLPPARLGCACFSTARAPNSISSSDSRLDKCDDTDRCGEYGGEGGDGDVSGDGGRKHSSTAGNNPSSIALASTGDSSPGAESDVCVCVCVSGSQHK
jgi:hypothetical protein